MNESFVSAPENEPQVKFAQDSGCMMLSVDLPGQVSLAGKVSYPYLNRGGDRDHENGRAEIADVDVVPSLNDQDGLAGFQRILATFLQNISPLSARILNFRLRQKYPEWLIRGSLVSLESYGLQISGIQSLKQDRFISREVFEKDLQQYLPANLIVKLGIDSRARLYRALAISE